MTTYRQFSLLELFFLTALMKLNLSDEVSTELKGDVSAVEVL